MTMGLVNINNSSKWANVDLATAQKVSEQIFQRAQNNATINTSRVAQVREIQGVDFYSRPPATRSDVCSAIIFCTPQLRSR